MADDTSGGFWGGVGDAFTNGLNQAATAYVDKRFKTGDPAQQYRALPDGQLINESNQSHVGATGTNYQPWIIAGGVLLAVVVLAGFLRR